MAKRPRRSTGFEAWLNSALTPVYLLDGRRRITVFNQGCEELTGWSAADVIGQRCHYTTEDDATSIAALLATLCPPAPVFQGEAAAVPSYVAHRDGQTTARMLQHLPLANREGRVDRVLTLALPLQSPPEPGRAAPEQQLHAELAALRSELRRRYGFATVVSTNLQMQRVLEQIKVACASHASVHLIGEAGTGREHLSRVLHNESQTRARSFVPLDCAALTALEQKRSVRRLLADPLDGPVAAHLQTGTLFLRDVQGMPRDVQDLLAEALTTRLAENEPIRLVTCSDRPLAALVSDEMLLPELYRLAGTLEIHVPPLRDRMDDLPPLAQFFVEQLNAGTERQVDGLAQPVLQELARYHWPGNVAELKTVIQNARAACDEDVVQPAHLPMQFRVGMDARRTPPPRALIETELEPLLTRVEQEHIRRVLEACGENRSEAARLLGITRARLYRRMEQLGLTTE